LWKKRGEMFDAEHGEQTTEMERQFREK
jgi:hypothetical protein